MAISEATRLQAQGASITLKDGSSVALIFDFDAIAAIERDYDNLDNFAEDMKDGCPVKCATKHVHRKTHKQMTAMRAGLLAALSHTGRPEKELSRLLDVRRVVAYTEALTEAFEQAMPEGTADPNAGGSRNGSPGSNSTTLPLSASVEPTPSSGA